MSIQTNKLLIDIGSTYFKISENRKIRQHFRNFDKNIFDDLSSKCGNVVEKYAKEDIHICSSANGGLSTLIIGLTNSFSLKYAVNIAFNSGINIIDTVLYPKIGSDTPTTEIVDVVIIVGGINSNTGIFDENLISYLDTINYQNIVYVGSSAEHTFLQDNIPALTILDNIISDKLQIHENELKTYLTDLYQSDIMGKEEIKSFYEITSNQIYSTPYIVNRSLSALDEHMDVADPFILIDIGGATTDIHYSRDLVKDNILTESSYDRLVFKKLGVYKSRESLVFSAKNNEFVFELLNFLNVTENILEEESEKATKVLMQLAIFLVLYKMSKHHSLYVELELEKLNSIVLTGGITKVLSPREVEEIILFFYRKLLHFHHTPAIILDQNYEIWTYGQNLSDAKE
ncbi:MAG: methylaspartate mutase [Epsilonproteobacteria bacterium]|nr:MAG: methylaspartate mutase [Campylobacterota bacterium]